jgi:hypothetical protein
MHFGNTISTIIIITTTTTIRCLQELGQAYQVLQNPQLRAGYDRTGKDATKDHNFVDPSAFFTVLFGSDKFQPYIGELALASMANVLGQVDTGNIDPQSILADLGLSGGKRKQAQLKRVVQCAVHLAERVQGFVSAAGKQDENGAEGGDKGGRGEEGGKEEEEEEEEDGGDTNAYACKVAQMVEIRVLRSQPMLYSSGVSPAYQVLTKIAPGVATAASVYGMPAGDSSIGSSTGTTVLWRRDSEIEKLRSEVRRLLLADGGVLPKNVTSSPLHTSSSIVSGGSTTVAVSVLSVLAQATGVDSSFFGQPSVVDIQVLLSAILQAAQQRAQDTGGAGGAGEGAADQTLQRVQRLLGRFLLSQEGQPQQMQQMQPYAQQQHPQCQTGDLQEAMHRFIIRAEKEAEELVQASYGDVILETIGYVYENKADQYLGGVQSYWAAAEDSTHGIMLKVNAAGTAGKALLAVKKVADEAKV